MTFKERGSVEDGSVKIPESHIQEHCAYILGNIIERKHQNHSAICSLWNVAEIKHQNHVKATNLGNVAEREAKHSMGSGQAHSGTVSGLLM